MDYFKPNPERNRRTKEVKSKMEDREQFSIKKLKKKRRNKHLTKNQKLHIVARHYQDIDLEELDGLDY